MSLDDQLQAIVASVLHPLPTSRKHIAADEQTYITRKVQQIHDAFVDADYVQTLKYDQRTVVLSGKEPLGYIVYYPDEMMTGQQWYQRFREEMHGRFIPFARKEDGELILLIEEIDKAAKRAAGIEDSHDSPA